MIYFMTKKQIKRQRKALTKPHKKVWYDCVCDCGNKITVCSCCLISGRVTSCGACDGPDKYGNTVIGRSNCDDPPPEHGDS